MQPPVLLALLARRLRLFLIFYLAVSWAAHAGGNMFGDAGHWREICSKEIEGGVKYGRACHNLIWGYMLGAMKFLQPEDIGRYECMDVKPEEEAAELFVRFVDANPELLNQDIQVVLPKFWGIDDCGL